mmetsp:Transcript_87643/g.195047  ORF Transcript_87643/g.195047 Transcript_87643/m.195047 type:complete len:300 (-) Transcript_87643:62-961(-)
MAVSPKLVSSAALALVAVLLQGWWTWDDVKGQASDLSGRASEAASSASEHLRTKFEDGKSAVTDLLCDRAVEGLVDKMEDAAFELLERQCKALVNAAGTKTEKEADEEEQDACLQRGSPGLEKAQAEATIKYTKECYDSVHKATSSISGGVSAGIEAAKEAINDFIRDNKDEVKRGATDMFNQAVERAKEQARAAAEAAREEAKKALAEEKFVATRPIAAGFQGKGPLATLISGMMLAAVMGSIACAAGLAARRGQVPATLSFPLHPLDSHRREQSSRASLAGHLRLSSSEEGEELMGI